MRQHAYIRRPIQDRNGAIYLSRQYLLHVVCCSFENLHPFLGVFASEESKGDIYIIRTSVYLLAIILTACTELNKKGPVERVSRKQNESRDKLSPEKIPRVLKRKMCGRLIGNCSPIRLPGLFSKASA